LLRIAIRSSGDLQGSDPEGKPLIGPEREVEMPREIRNLYLGLWKVEPAKALDIPVEVENDAV
jgi:hypothetical protein